MLRITFLEIFFSLFRGEIRIDSKDGLSGQANPCDFEGRHVLNCTFIRPYRIIRRSTQRAQKGEFPYRVHRDHPPRGMLCVAAVLGRYADGRIRDHQLTF